MHSHEFVLALLLPQFKAAMPKSHIAEAKKSDKQEGWRLNLADGRLLVKLFKNKELSPGVAPGALKKLCPQFKKCKADLSASGLCRIKAKMGLNVRSNGECWCCHFVVNAFIVDNKQCAQTFLSLCAINRA